MKTMKWMLGLVLAGTLAAQAEDLVIQSFDSSGKLTFNELTNATEYRVEWACTVGGAWTNSWNSLNGIPAVGSGTVTVSVPMVYRVVATVVTVPTISQVYGGGGSAGATYKNDFIELYNAGRGTLDLSNYAVQYASATSSTWSKTLLSGTLAPGHYYLIQEASAGPIGADLPNPQATGTINLSSTGGKVALTKTQTLLTVSNPVGDANVIDFVGYGTANAYEGAGAALATSSTTANFRAGGGATDTDNNSSDFSTGLPNPRNN